MAPSYWQQLLGAVAPAATTPATPAPPAPLAWNQAKEDGATDPWDDVRERETCEKWATIIFESQHVQYLVEELRLLGREMTRDHVKCVGTGSRGMSALTGTGGYIWTDTPDGGLRKGDITVSQRDCNSSHTMSTALRHEMIHAFDDARANVDPSNCFHQACSEIRASRLSGECAISEELLRGRSMSGDGSGLALGEQCVKRRAILSVEQNPACSRLAEASVDQVWEQCLADNAPFHKFPLEIVFKV